MSDVAKPDDAARAAGTSPADIGTLRFDVAIGTPPPSSRGETGIAVAVAAAMHILVVAGLDLAGSHRVGTGSLDIETLGVEIVVDPASLDEQVPASSSSAAATPNAGAAQPDSASPAFTDQAERTTAPAVSEVPGIVVADERTQSISVPESLEPPRPPQEEPGNTVPSAPSAPADPANPEAKLASEAQGGAAMTPYQRAVNDALSRRPPRVPPGRTGRVTVGFVIDEDGIPRGIRVTRSSGDVELDRAAIETVRSARFPPRPPTPAERSYEIPYIFR